MDFNKFIDFIGKNLDFLNKDDVKYIIGGDYATLFNRLNERYQTEQDPGTKKRLEEIAIFLEKFIQSYNTSSYKFSYDKCEVFEHYKYWFEFYMSNNYLVEAEKVLKDVNDKFPDQSDKISKLRLKYDKSKKAYEEESEKLRKKILKKNKFKQIELLIGQMEYGKAMYEALELLNEFPNEPQIKKYLARIDALKTSNVKETTKVGADFFEKVGLLSLTKSTELQKSDLKEIYKKLSYLRKSGDYDAGLSLISYIKDKYKIEDTQLVRFQNAFVEEKSRIQLKQQSDDYNLELGSLKLLIKNKQYKEALAKANTILKKYPLIDKKIVFAMIQKVDRERRTVLNQKNKLDVWFEDLQFRLAKLSKKGLMQFYEKMAWFLNAKIDVKLSLQIIYYQSKDLGLKKFVKSLIEGLDSGMKISEVLRWYSLIGRSEVALIKIGETTGQLGKMFKIIAGIYKENETRKKKIKSVMMYPMVVIFVTIAIFAALLVFVMPKFKEMFSTMGFELPLITRIVLALSDIIMYQWYFLIGGGIGISTLYSMFSRTNQGRHFNSWLTLKLPIISSIVYRKYIIHISTNVSMLLQSGINLLEALDLVIYGTENVLFREEFSRIRFELETGVTFAKAIGLGSIEDVGGYSNKFIPIDLAYSVDIGEKTGQLGQMLGEVAVRYDEDLKMIIQNLNNLMEPFIIVLVGGMVFVFVMAVFMPLMSVYNNMAGG